MPSLSTMTCSHFIFSTFSSDCKAVRCFSISMHSCLQYSLKKMSLETFELCAHLVEKSCGSILELLLFEVIQTLLIDLQVK